jgi:hypothetical protein
VVARNLGSAPLHQLLAIHQPFHHHEATAAEALVISKHVEKRERK